MTIGSFSVKNPVLINIVMVFVLVIGVVSVLRLPREQFSEIPFFFVFITVPYPGVAAEDVEQSVTVPIENEIAGLDSIDQVRSFTSEGFSQVQIQFDQGIDDDEFAALLQEVRNRFANLELPDGTLQATIDDFSSNDFLPVVEVVLSGSVPYGQLLRAAETLEGRLTSIPDLASVTLVGARERRISIELDRDRIEALGVSIDEVVGAVRAQNITVPGGTLRTGEREFLVRTVGQVSGSVDFENVVLRRVADGVVRIGDVARVEQGFDANGTSSRFNGRPAITLRVAKVPGGSSIGVIDAVRDRSARFARTMPGGIALDFINDSSIQIRDSLKVLVWNALFGLVLLVVILLLFIGVRNALMTALGIPLTFAVSFIALNLAGDTLNGNTLFALVLVLGLIVDHAIVIVENSFRLQHETGLSRRDAAIRGVDQVIVPVIAATATTVAAFLPLTFLPGIIGRFLRVVPITVSIALIASTFEAAVFLPSHFADWPGGTARRGISIAGLQTRFRRLGRRWYARRWSVIRLSLAALGVGIGLVLFVEQDLFAAEESTLYFIDIDMPSGTPPEATGRFVARYEERLLPLVGNGEVVAFNAFIGFRGDASGNQNRSNIAQIVVDLTERDEGRTRSIDRIMAEAQQLTRDIPGADSIRFSKQQSGPPTDPPVVFRLFGDSLTDLAEVARAIELQLLQNPDLINVRDNLDAGTPELRIVVDEQRAAGLGLSTQEVGGFLRAAIDGIDAGSVFSDNRETDVLVGYGHDDRVSVADLIQYKIPTGDGRQIAFGTVASLETATALGTIRRLDGKREVTVSADTIGDIDTRAIDTAIARLFTDELAPRYPDVELDVRGQFADIAETLQGILRVFLVGVFLIYLILATQFNSYAQPLLVLLTVPFAFVGVVVYLVVSGSPLSTVVVYAAVALAGIAVNDTIVLVSFANELVAGGTARAEAITEAAVLRLRPILLTSLTTIAGLLPTALGLGGRSVVWGPMARTIIFGLTFSTLTTLVIVPSFYGALYDVRRFFTVRVFGGARPPTAHREPRV